ncbi:VOC family protein [Sphingobium sp. CFD-1]|uniref:VOC family protein n=1 Tax=Sphingobium sp. CFD-1 TaxID=2878545 RepID=UPI00214ADAE0|nr:VOC family protein [Sphingobium sp. CFD-1]
MTAAVRQRKKGLDMQQQISVITLGIRDLPRSRRFYTEGFGWAPVFENDEIIFYQMNGLVLGTFEASALEKDMSRFGLLSPGAFSLAHNVPGQADVEVVIGKLANAGGRIIRPADAPPPGGFRGYVADPDDHAWEIAWNPAWLIDENGLVQFAI